jgi:hypothetical protein
MTRLDSPSHRAAPRWILAATLVGALALVPRVGRTQAAAWDEALATSLNGTWVLAVSEARARELLEAGITTAISGLPPLVDSVAAGRLRDRTPISPRITLTMTRERIEARFAHATFTSAPGASTRIPVPGDTSTTMEMTQILRDGHFEQIFTTDEGRRWNTLTPTSDGRMNLDAVVHSERLSNDLRFRIPYRRGS